MFAKVGPEHLQLNINDISSKVKGDHVLSLVRDNYLPTSGGELVITTAVYGK